MRKVCVLFFFEFVYVVSLPRNLQNLTIALYIDHWVLVFRCSQCIDPKKFTKKKNNCVIYYLIYKVTFSSNSRWFVRSNLSLQTRTWKRPGRKVIIKMLAACLVELTEWRSKVFVSRWWRTKWQSISTVFLSLLWGNIFFFSKRNKSEIL